MRIAARKLLKKIRDRKLEPDVERLRTALSRSGLPDRVPFMELFADREIVAAVMGKPLDYFSRELQGRKEWEQAMLTLMEFYETLGYDYMRYLDQATLKAYRGYAFASRRKFSSGKVGSRSFKYSAADVAPDLSRGERLWANEGTSLIADWDDFRAYEWEDPDEVAEDVDEGLAWVCDHAPPGMGIVTGGGAVLEPAWMLMGVKNFYVSLFKQPDLVDAIFKKVAEVSLTRFKILAKTSRKILAFWGADDWGYKKGLMISPAMLKRWVFTPLREMADIAHSKGALFLLHCCGNVRTVMDDIIDYIKVDGKHAFEDTYLPVTEAKRLYGQRIAIIGGIDMDVISRSSPAEVREYVSRVLKICKEDGGYCLGSGNSIANYVPLENYLTMLDVGLEEGCYT